MCKNYITYTNLYTLQHIVITAVITWIEKLSSKHSYYSNYFLNTNSHEYIYRINVTIYSKQVKSILLKCGNMYTVHTETEQFYLFQ